MMRIAVCPGSFDPITCGHMDIIRRAAALFDRVIVAVTVNVLKKTSFTEVERLKMTRKATQDIDNVVIDVCDRLLADYVRDVNACAIVKGLRAVTDFEIEFQMALVNRELYSGAETIFLTTGTENMYLSSSVVKHIGYFGGDISSYVPECILEDIKERIVGIYKPIN
ncbi:MAG: pantetheine-phosphate adenylyltransferase [Oscillospiraceae bacterium]|nr:pantetheine-phosphate adenylyltransferase [Oscillospiraceae bacterium]